VIPLSCILSLPAPEATQEGSMLKQVWIFKGTEYYFSYPVTRSWAKWYHREREGYEV
jgi:hypothetical protein